MINATILQKADGNTFRPRKLAEDTELTNINFSKLILCSKACDGTYHQVNSSVGQILGEHKNTLTNGGFQIVINKFFDEEIHGKRFLVYPNGKNALLIGNLFFGLKKLAKLK